MKIDWLEPVKGFEKHLEQAGEIEIVVGEKLPAPVVLAMHEVSETTSAVQESRIGWLDIDEDDCGRSQYPSSILQILNEDGEFVSWSAPKSQAHKDELEVPAGHYRILSACRAYWRSSSHDYLSYVLAADGPVVAVRAGETTKIHVGTLTAEDIYRIAVKHLRSWHPNLEKQ